MRFPQQIQCRYQILRLLCILLRRRCLCTQRSHSRRITRQRPRVSTSVPKRPNNRHTLRPIVSNRHRKSKSRSKRCSRRRNSRHICRRQNHLRRRFRRFTRPSPSFLTRLMCLLLSMRICRHIRIPRQPTRFIRPLVVHLITRGRNLHQIARRHLTFRPILLFLVFPRIRNLLFSRKKDDFTCKKGGPISYTRCRDKGRRSTGTRHRKPRRQRRICQFHP